MIVGGQINEICIQVQNWVASHRDVKGALVPYCRSSFWPVGFNFDICHGVALWIWATCSVSRGRSGEGLQKSCESVNCKENRSL